MKLPILALAGIALITLAGCNRGGAADNAAGNVATDTGNEAAPAAGNEAGAKPAGGDEAAPPAEGGEAAPADEKPADAGGGTTDASSDDQPEGEADK